MKPWGTGHAVLSCIHSFSDVPIAVINADDYYGKNAFRLIYNYLTGHGDDGVYRYAMVGYSLKNTVTDNGSVSRGRLPCGRGGESSGHCGTYTD